MVNENEELNKDLTDLIKKHFDDYVYVNIKISDKKPKEPLIGKFLAGWIFAFSVISLFQDYYGKEGFIEHIQNHWVSPWVSVPIAILGVVISLYSLNQADKLGK